MPTTQNEKEFSRQVENLIAKGYPSKEILKHIEPLRKIAKKITESEVDLAKGKLAFVIVIKSELVPAEKMMSLVVRDGKQGVTKMRPHKPTDFNTIDGVDLPNSKVYLLIDIDRGRKTINVIPSEAMKTIRKNGRSPLTIDEGIAIMTQYPEFLMKNNCFSLLASRHTGDKRVPAIWINAAKNPNLGWCWDGNPHTWLGSASCGSRK